MAPFVAGADILRIERGIRKKARQIVAAHEAAVSRDADEHVLRVLDLVRRVNELSNIAPERSSLVGSIELNLIDGSGSAIFVTQEFIEALTQRHDGLIA